MSKLPNAPLLEVIFELRWNITNNDDLARCQYIHGDLYSILKNKYPYREALWPPEFPADMLLNKPVHRFRHDKNDYPLFQVGPGILTLNTTDPKYYWDEFASWSEELLNAFKEVFVIDDQDRFSPKLVYFDFFRFDFELNEVVEFINKNFNISIEQSFYKPNTPSKNLMHGFYYNTHLGDLAVNIRRGKNGNQDEGIILETNLSGAKFILMPKDILDWLNQSHDFISDLFQKLTEGPFYESFK